MTCLSYKNSWEEICIKVQELALNNTQLNVKSANSLYGEILNCLQIASDDGILLAKQYEILKLVQKSKSSEIKKKGYYAILGGKKNQKRDPNIPHFKLHNGCWFDFTITIDETSKPSQIIGFDFEIRFPKREDEVAVPFLRIDLNLPEHNNELKNLRFHLHPSNDVIMIHSPPMSPLEILHMFLYGIKIAEKPRATRS